MNTHVRERVIFVQSSPAFLTRLDAMIEELIAMRDALDAGPDLEDGGDYEDGADDEPSSSWTDGEASSGRYRLADPRTGGVFADEGEVTMPTMVFGYGFAGSQAVPARMCGYQTPDDAEDSFDAEVDVLDEPHDREPDEPNLATTPYEDASGDYAVSGYIDAERDTADDEDSDEDVDIVDQPHDWNELEESRTDVTD